MAMVIKSYKYRVYPTCDQEAILSQFFGCTRFIYNYFLNLKQVEYENNGKRISFVDSTKLLTSLKKQEGYSWLNSVHAQCLQQSLKDLDAAYTRFFKKLAGPPRFKKKDGKQSFRFPQDVSVKNGVLRLPVFKDKLDTRTHRPIEGKIKYATLSKTCTGKYFVSITCESEHVEYKKSQKEVGIDTGLKSLCILSDGTTYDNLKPLKNRLKDLRYAQRQLSKKQRGSSSKNRQRLSVAGIYEKISNIRKEYLHKTTTEIVKNHDLICVETLAVSNLIKNRRLAQSFSDASIGMLYGMLEYKCRWNGKSFIKINRFFPSSRTCSKCNWVNNDLTLNDRKWTCEKCLIVHDRDLNAAINILNQGRLIIDRNADVKQKQGEAFSSEKFKNPDVLIEHGSLKKEQGNTRREPKA